MASSLTLLTRSSTETNVRDEVELELCENRKYIIRVGSKGDRLCFYVNNEGEEGTKRHKRKEKEKRNDSSIFRDGHKAAKSSSLSVTFFYTSSSTLFMRLDVLVYAVVLSINFNCAWHTRQVSS